VKMYVVIINVPESLILIGLVPPERVSSSATPPVYV
jgi:hypothetical protein